MTDRPFQNPMPIEATMLAHVTRHVPLHDATWRLVRSSETEAERTDAAMREVQPFGEWRCIAPECAVLVRVFALEESTPLVSGGRRIEETLWQETVIWHERRDRSQPPRLPSVELVQYVKSLFVGTSREATLVLPPSHEVRPEDEWRVSLFTLLGHSGRVPESGMRALPRLFTLLPPLP